MTADCGHTVSAEAAPLGTRPRKDTLLWAGGVIALACCGMYSPIVTVILAAGSLALLFTPVAGWITLAFFALVAGFGAFIDYMPVRLGVFNAYVMDFILVIYVWTFLRLYVARLDGKEIYVSRPPAERRLYAIWVLWSSLGLFFLFYGYYIQGNPFDRAFGEFRRSTVYSMAFFVPLVFPFSRRQLRSIDYAILAAGLITVAIGMYRLSTGTAARADENWETGHIAVRWMRMVECTTLAGLITLLTVFLYSGKGFPQKAAATLLVTIAATLLVLSGFRLAMGYALAAPVLAVVLLAWARGESLRRFIRVAVVSVVAVVPALLLLPLVLPDVFDKMLLDLHLRLVNEGIQGGFRTWAYQAAIQRFLESPLIGHGFGYYLTVGLRNQSGMFDYVEMNNPHNMFLAVLYLTGLVGFIPFMAFHVLFAVYAVKGVRRVEDQYRRTYITLFVVYATYIAYMCIQPYVSSPFILVYMIMGFMVRLARPPVSAEMPDAEIRPCAEDVAVGAA